jgi:hypothetical protein
MPLVGFEQLAKATKGTPLQQQLLLHTYTLLEGPGQVTEGTAGAFQQSSWWDSILGYIMAVKSYIW